MNATQRLLRVNVVVLVAMMITFPPYRVQQNNPVGRWVTYAPIWEPPYPTREETLPSMPYCPEGHASVLILLVQIAALWMGSSVAYVRLGKFAFDRDKYPEYYRP